MAERHARGDSPAKGVERAPHDAQLSPTAPRPVDHVAARELVRRSKRRLSRRRHLRGCLCSLSTVVTLVYLVFLVCVALIVAATTQAKVTELLHATWTSVHTLKVARVGESINSVVAAVVNTSLSAAALYVDSNLEIESNATLSMLCATLTMMDTRNLIRMLALGNLHRAQYADAGHGDPTSPSIRNVTVLLSNHNQFYGLFYMNPDTCSYDDPPVMKGPLNQSMTAQQMMLAYASTDPIFDMIDAYVNHSITTIPAECMWHVPPYQPSFIFHTLPVALLGRQLVGTHPADIHDYVQVRLSGKTLLSLFPRASPLTVARVMVLANRTVSSADPIVLANNWGQEVVQNESYSAIVDTHTTYLKVSSISDPLMREAVKHVDLRALQQQGYNTTVTFRYRNAAAMVTAHAHTTPCGLQVPLVLVSSQESVTGPYLMIFSLCNGMLALAIILLTALCYFAMDRYLARPLRRVTVALKASVRRGVRQPVRADACDVVQLTETRELTAAYNTAVAQLRVVDAFVPTAALGGSDDILAASPGSELQSRFLTILTVHIQSAHDRPTQPPQATVVNTQPAAEAADAPRSVGMTHHGPFSSAADVEAFVAAVLRLSEVHHGAVHRVAPDQCVLHFGAAASRGGPANVDAVPRSTQRLIAQDARDALAFAFALLHWADHRAGPGVPDVRVLVDTGVFVCGQYRAACSEQTLSVALGRDVDRSVGHVPAKIGVRVAMTEETALRVRGGGVLAGVRQLPVEALRTGRVDLDADVVILYEALPGPVAGDAAWRRYAHSYFDGFDRMLRGDYATALTAFAAVADIADLEPGLVPSRFQREAAHSNVTGGAVSTQVERLMRECERRIATHWTQGFHRTPVRLLGLDVVLAALAQQRRALQSSLREAEAVGDAAAVSGATRRRGAAVGAAGLVEKRRGRYGLDVRNPLAPSSAVRIACVMPGTARRTTHSAVPACFVDNWGQEWCVGKTPAVQLRREMHARALPALSTGGTLGVVQLRLYRDVPPIVAAALAGVPDGPLSDAARHAVPFWLPSAAQREAVHKLFGPCLRLRHANMLACLGYSIAYEGGAVVVTEPFRGADLHELRAQFPGELSCCTVTRLGCSIIEGLLFLHANGIVHGELRPECVLVCSDGVCRLKGFYTDYALAHRVLCLPRTCYVSPEVAAGQPPTPASDVFGYGLVMLEVLTRERPWAWAPVAGEGPQRSAVELEELMVAGGDAFNELVVQRLVVPAVDRLDRVSGSRAFSEASAYVVRRCLEWDAAERVTLREALNGTIRAGKLKRAHRPVQCSLLHFGDSDGDANDTTSTGSDDALVQVLF